MNVFDWKKESSWPDFLGQSEIMDEGVSEEQVWEFYNSYTHIRAYHAARPIDPELYYSEGIRLADYRALEHSYRTNMEELFGIDISQESLDYAKKQIEERHNRLLFLVLDDREFLENSPEYAQYGSEYVHALALQIERQFGVRSAYRLREIGTPTIFEVQLDIDLVTTAELNNLVCNINNFMYYEKIAHVSDYVIELAVPVPGDFIVRHYHPNL